MIALIPILGALGAGLGAGLVWLVCKWAQGYEENGVWKAAESARRKLP